MTLLNTLKIILVASCCTWGFLYVMVATFLGWNPATWHSQIEEEQRLVQLDHDRADYDRLCKRPRP